MQVDSFLFVLVFLPVVVFLYHAFGKNKMRYKKGLLVICSLLFYSYSGCKSVAVLICSLGINIVICVFLKKSTTAHITNFILATGIVLNLLLLGYLKYTNFIIQNINAFWNLSITEKTIILPAGISFFTFQQIMFIIYYARNGEKNIGFVDYLVYVLYFPKLLMGPLADPKSFLNELQTVRGVDYRSIVEGIQRIVVGLFKKVIVAEAMINAVEWGSNYISESTALDLIIVSFAYTMQIYFDFCGYSDIAIGVSKMFNIYLPNNFDSPYRATSISDFWRKWHISLTNFLTEYVYIPLGGNRKGRARTYFNILIVFLVSGIWHGANWTFIVWGIIYGMLMVVEKLLYRQINRIPKIIGRIYTLSIVNILWMFFWLDSIDDVLYAITKIWKGVFSGSWVISESLKQCFLTKEMSAMIYLLNNDYISNHGTNLAMIVVVCVSTIICQFPINSNNIKYKANTRTVFTTVILATWCFISMSVRTAGFIYSGF